MRSRHSRATAPFVSLVALLALGGAARAADPDPPASAMGVSSPGSEMKLSLAEAIALALENNLDVEVQRFEPLISGEQEMEAWGAYDPELFSEFGYASNKNPNAFGLNQQAVSLDKLTDGFGGFRGLVPYLGSQYSFQFNGQRATTNSTVQSLSPEFRSSFSLNFTQPLLRGLIWNQPWTRVKTSRVLYDQSLQNFRRQVMDTVQLVEDDYWNLIATEEQREVAKKSLETAKALLDQTQTQFEVGVVSKVEVIESEAGVADREFNLIVAENRYQAAQDQLINRILGTGLRPDTTIEIEPTDNPKDYITYEIDPKRATERAFETRPELEIRRDEIERQKLEVKFAKNERLPKLDAQVTYSERGLSGHPNPNSKCSFMTGAALAACLAAPDPRPDQGNWGNSMNDFITNDAADSYSARALFSIPLPNTVGRSRVSQRELELRRAVTNLRREEQNVILEVRNAVRNLDSSQEGIEAAHRASAAAAEQLRAERIRLEYGESTPFDVLQREEDFVQAESREINAFQTYRASVTGLNRAQGTILESNNIAIDDVSGLR